ncbi:hypothetical protein MAA_03308 [Metarhizium robertsii ARSEF 23]|uniref:Clr5 domain-containing protein n=1 Tax=Metarhizium robertsii (strain ARSEF 23 / ATCC MYA-3075) TaxID=655844 RepID=E9ETF9_METRA|nr:uncharacterized protein MAA_03308 [Metarhizium robertsii ARSEF 23]EFZ00712.1 hypothetical protein MAA_03308 [Metarhizium robertsii ARSEF 23]
MFNLPPDKSRASDFNTDSYGFNNQAWSAFDFGQGAPSSSSLAPDHNHDTRQSFSDAGGMEWAPTSSNVQPNYTNGHHEHQDHQGDTAMELEALSSPQTGRGVGRLVAHFENKGFNPFENKSFEPPPPLPPRPANTTVNNNQSHHQAHQQVEQNPSISMNSFQASLSFDPLSYCGNGISSTASSVFNPNRITNPVTGTGQSWGEFASLQRVTSPIAASPPAMSYSNFQDNRVGSSSAHFGNLDDFMSDNRIHSSMAHSPIPDSHLASSPMVASPMTQSLSHSNAAPVGGTPGFEIWRPPGTTASTTTKMNQSQPNNFTTPLSATNSFITPSGSHSTATSTTNRNSIGGRSSTNSAGFLKPPVPTTPKPNIGVGNQFILELIPSAKAKGKAPAKPPRPRVPPPVPISFAADIKQEPMTPSPSTIPPASSTPTSLTPSTTLSDQKPGSISLRGQAGTRPSREQVPAEAWEQFKGTIRSLYLEERKPLKEVMAIMAEKYNFQATPKMYKTRFSQWGFVKNNTEEEVKKLLSMKFQRDAEGKVSEFVRNGRVVNLGTYLKRKGVTEYDLVDFELSADLPAHVRCRTPTPPPAPGYLRSPDLLRAQELVVGNMRKAFLHCRQFEVETDARIGWPITMVWGAGSSDLLLEANFYFEARDADQGGDFLMKAFKQLELDLKKLSPLGINELLLGMVHRDPGMMTALCKYLAAYSSTNFERSHPLRQIFACLYEVQQKHGSATVSELLWGSMPTIAEELEAIYSRRHPYVTRTWIDLALFHNHVNADRLDKLASELRLQQRQVDQRYGTNSTDALTLRYSILQLLYVVNSQSDLTRHAAHDLWNHLKSMCVVFGLRDAKPNVFCYHSPVKVDPWTKRCRRRYDSGVAILEEHVGVRVQPYFEEDFHHAVHVPDAQEAWSSALGHMSSGKYSFI